MGLGLIRLLLAEAVIMAHSYNFFGYKLLDPFVAVEIFFIISGFYMAMILDGKYNDYWLFIKNRFLRLYPIYITVIILTVLLCVLSFFTEGKWFKLSPFIDQFHSFYLGSYIFIIFANLSMLFQDVIMFSGLHRLGNLFFVSADSSIAGPRLLLIPQAWTLGLEWVFYFIAPFITKRRKTVITLLLLSLAIKVTLASTGFVNDQWRYRFFPAELYLFCGGILAYDLYNKYKDRINLKIAKIITFIVIGYIFIFNFLPIPELILYAAFTLAMPFIFFYSKNIKSDRKTGELSYPVYLSHVLIIYCLEKINLYAKLSSSFEFLLISAITICFSLLLIKYIQTPIDKIREFNLIKNNYYSNLYLYLSHTEETS